MVESRSPARLGDGRGASRSRAARRRGGSPALGRPFLSEDAGRRPSTFVSLRAGGGGSPRCVGGARRGTREAAGLDDRSVAILGPR